MDYGARSPNLDEILLIIFYTKFKLEFVIGLFNPIEITTSLVINKIHIVLLYLFLEFKFLKKK